MKSLAGYSKKLKYTYIKTTIVTLFICMLFVKGYTPVEKTGDNLFHVFLDGTEMGVTDSEEHARELITAARRNVAKRSSELTFIDFDVSFTGEEVLFGKIDSDDSLTLAIENKLSENIVETMQRAYSLKVNEYMVNLASASEAVQLLQAAIDKYDTEGEFIVDLVHDANHEFNVLTANVSKKEAKEAAFISDNMEGGIQEFFSELEKNMTTQGELDFSEYDLGIKSMNFSEKVKIVETYLPQSEIADLGEAIEYVTKEQETPAEYQVVSGDTLSEISIKVNIPIENIIALNSDALENENSTIRVGQKLIITVPEPELSVERIEENYYEEIYDADIEYIDRNDWYTYQTNVIQQPSAGFRKIVADAYYVNEKLVEREILKEEVVKEAVPKIVERGTKIPPTYLKPISGGRLSSNFGPRTAPKKGASTYHKGVDWAIPTGSAVYASSGGTVSKAGWGSGYGYVVYIDHSDGRQTRYGHLSKVLVKAGQTVKQGEKIALSGNTGVSTGPHLHFEILIGGKQVNPLKYLN